MLKRKKKRSREFKEATRIIDMNEARQERHQKRAAAAKHTKKKQGKGADSPRSEVRAAKKAKKRFIYTAIFIGIIAVVGVTLFHIYTLQSQEKALMAEYKSLKKEKEKLNYELTQIDTPEYIEQQARQMLRMIKPGEILYVLPKDKDSATKSAIMPNKED